MGFFSNNCRFEACGLKCSSLLELVEHIEQVHVPPSEFEAVTVGISPSSILRLCAFPYVSAGTMSQTSTGSSLISSASDYEDAASDSGQGSIDSNSLYNKSDSSNLTSPISLNGLKLEVDANNNAIMMPVPAFVCNVENCNRSYKSHSNLTQHQQNAHNIIQDQSDRHICPKCRRSYKTPKGLKSHQRNAPECHLSPIVGRILKPADQNSTLKKLKAIQLPKKLPVDGKIAISELQQRLLTPVMGKPT